MTKASKTRAERSNNGNQRDNVVRSLHVPDTQVELSNPAALRAFRNLSTDGQAMLMAMIRWAALPEHADTDRPVLGAAADDAGLFRWTARAGADELIDTGLLRRTRDGTLVLHPMFSVIGHQLRRAGQMNERADGSDNNVVAFG